MLVLPFNETPKTNGKKLAKVLKWKIILDEIRRKVNLSWLHARAAGAMINALRGVGVDGE